jgi:hypothetical protein
MAKLKELIHFLRIWSLLWGRENEQVTVIFRFPFIDFKGTGWICGTFELE